MIMVTPKNEVQQKANVSVAKSFFHYNFNVEKTVRQYQNLLFFTCVFVHLRLFEFTF